MQLSDAQKSIIKKGLVSLLSGVLIIGSVYGLSSSGNKAEAASRDPVEIKLVNNKITKVKTDEVSRDYVLPSDSGNTVRLHTFTSDSDSICDECGLIRFIDIYDLDTPVTGTELDKTVEYDASKGTTCTISWSPYPTDGKAKANTAYTVTISISPKKGYTFADNIEVKYEGVAATYSLKSGSIVMTKSFGKTGPDPVVTSDTWEIDSSGYITKYKGTDKNVTIPSTVNNKTVKGIGIKAFANNTTIQSVVIPDTVEVIGEKAFVYCTNLKTVTFGKNVKTIDKYAFSSTGLESVTLPDSLKTIAYGAFWECGNLTSVYFPSGIETISGRAFMDCNLDYVCVDTTKFSGAFDPNVPLHKFDNADDHICNNCKCINMVDISGIDAPKAGEDLDISVDYNDKDCISLNVSWDPLDSKAKEGTKYTITMVFTPKSGYSFDGNTKAAIDGQAYESVLGADGKLTVKKKYPSTPSTTTDPTSSVTPSTPSPSGSGSTTDPSSGSTSDPSGSTVKEASFEDFIERLYVVALGRPSEKEGKEFWMDMVKNHGFTGADCARAFLMSDEFRGLKRTDEEFLSVLYFTFFDRDPKDDKAGHDFWLDSIKKAGRDNAIEGFINSPEWCDLCAFYNVKSGAPTAKATVASSNATLFATRLYTECLGRDPEDEGLKFWALSLTNLEVSGYDAAKLFFTSPEFVGFNTTDDEFIARLYLTFMGREKDTDGMNYWKSRLKGGSSRDQIIKEFAMSPEFTDICNTYGIERGDI